MKYVVRVKNVVYLVDVGDCENAIKKYSDLYYERFNSDFGYYELDSFLTSHHYKEIGFYRDGKLTFYMDEGIKIEVLDSKLLKKTQKEFCFNHSRIIKRGSELLLTISRLYNVKHIIINTEGDCDFFKVNDGYITFSIDYYRRFTKLCKSIGIYYGSRCNIFQERNLAEFYILNYSLGAGLDSLVISLELERNLNTLFGNIIKSERVESHKSLFEKFTVELEKKLLQGHNELTYQDILENLIKIIYPNYTEYIREYVITTVLGQQKKYDFYLKGLTSDCIIELKKPSQQIISEKKTSGSYTILASIAKACLQLTRYKIALENKYHDENINKEVKCILIVGTHLDFIGDKEKNETFQIMKDMYNQIEILTYEDFLNMCKSLISNFE